MRPFVFNRGEPERMREGTNQESHHRVAPDGGNHNDHHVDNEEFLRSQYRAGREFFPSEVKADDSEKGEDCVKEERDEVQKELRLNHLSRVSKPIGVPDNEHCPDKQCAEGDSRCKGTFSVWHACIAVDNLLLAAC